MIKKSIKSGKSRRCFNCGSDQHESSSCPDKDKGPKCFSCGTFGHKSSSCVDKKDKSQKKDKKVAANLMIVPNKKRVSKEVTVNEKKVKTLFDTGSDINIIQKSVFNRYNFGTMKKVNFEFLGVGAENHAIGYFDIKVVVDGDKYDDICFVIGNQDQLPGFVIGLSIMNQGEVTINANGLSMKKGNSKDETTSAKEINDELCALLMCTLNFQNLVTFKTEIFKLK